MSSAVARWERAVQYRWRCEGGCGEERVVAVIKRRGRKPIRLCRTCYEDGFWKKEDQRCT